jgi:nitrite reductase/ring-hydroxylating ferredoxin subunit
MDGSGAVRTDRHPGDTYGDILERDSRPVPEYLREGRIPEVGVDPIRVSRYLSPEFFELEARYVWSKVWQMACREEDIPNVGDYNIYEILGKSLIVTRTASGEIKAFYNTCLHRGRKLVTNNGCKSEFRCPYHGIAWNTDGSFKDNPIGWDFPQWDGEPMNLPEARVDTWGGFVFVNFDLNAKPLMHYIKPLADHFEKFDWKNRYRSVWVQKKIRANWKVVAEAFMESHHSVTTHPQILPGLADANSQYDVLNDWVSRQFSAGGVASPFVGPLSEQEIVDYLTGTAGSRRTRPMAGDGERHIVPAGETARRYVADLTRKALTEETGVDHDAASDAELMDALLYNVFPHMSFWAGHAGKLTYRWRPNGTDPHSALMDIMIHSPCPKDKPRPPPAPMIQLDFHEPMSSIEGLGGGLAAVFDQDFSNLPFVHEGLTASGNGLVHFAKYTEMRIRHLHHMIDRLIAEGSACTTALGA